MYNLFMVKNKYKLKAKVWVYPGPAAWHFVTLPKKESAQIKKGFQGLERGWGSFPVAVTVGKTTWKTSIFPDKKAGAYLLPIKSEVRKKEKIFEDQTITFNLEIKV